MLLQYDSGRECAASWRSTTLLSKSLYLVIKYYIGDALVHDITRPPLSLSLPLLTVTSTVSDVVTQLFILDYSIQLPANTFCKPCKYFYTKKIK